MAQSYVGKHAVSKGFGGDIRKFVVLAPSRAHVPKHLRHRRTSRTVAIHERDRPGKPPHVPAELLIFVQSALIPLAGDPDVLRI
jgi:hypothetical protein